VFSGNSYEFSSTLKLLGVSNLENLPRLTGPWGEPGIIAIFAAFLSAIHIFQTRRWSPKVQIPLILSILVAQSFGGTIVFLVVTVSSIFFLDAKSISKVGRNFRRLVVLGFAGMFFQVVLIQSESKFSSNTVSLTDRSGEKGALDLLGQIFANPLGAQSSGGINLLQATVNSGLPTLFLGLTIFLALPLIAVKQYGFSPIFLVPLVVVAFVQPPALPIWLAFLGIFFGSLEQRNLGDTERNETKTKGLISIH
jgi:hypothetical protein